MIREFEYKILSSATLTRFKYELFIIQFSPPHVALLSSRKAGGQSRAIKGRSLVGIFLSQSRDAGVDGSPPVAAGPGLLRHPDPPPPPGGRLHQA